MNSNENNDRVLQEELNRLKAEHQRLRDDKVRTGQDLDNLTRQLDELQARAKKEYGTSDPAELRKLLDQKRAENSKMVAEYRAHLESINEGLKDVEAQTMDPEA